MKAIKQNLFHMLFLIIFLFSTPVIAAELKQKTIEAFDHYIQLTENRINKEIAGGSKFLWPDFVAEQRRMALYDNLRKGKIIIEQIQTLEKGESIEVPDGMIHHWLGLVFLPKTNLEKTLKFATDYEHHQDYFQPEVLQSKLLSHDGNHYKSYLRLYKKKVVTVILNTQHDVFYFPMNATRIHSRSIATRIAEVENPGKPDEREKPVGKDRGFLWRLNSYWRFEEKDGGVYAQCEAISLTRDIPPGVGWLMNSFINSVPRESLWNTLESTRIGIAKIK